MSTTFAEALLHHAEDMATTPHGSDASMARAVSTAYYALFHLLVDEATSTLFPTHSQALADATRRAFQHTAMKELCAQVAKGNWRQLTPAVQQVFVDPVEPKLAIVARAFVDLQLARHQADYAPHQELGEARVTALVQQAIDAFDSWKQVKSNENAKAFCVGLLLYRSWRIE